MDEKRGHKVQTHLSEKEYEKFERCYLASGMKKDAVAARTAILSWTASDERLSEDEAEMVSLMRSASKGEVSWALETFRRMLKK